MNGMWSKTINLKLKLYENKLIIIENYRKLHDFQSEYIMIDSYLIVGNFLKISKMDGSVMEIEGTISEIKVLEEKK